MMSYAELEISLHRRGGECYVAEFRFSQPDSDTDIRCDPVEVRFDFNELRAQSLDANAYGQLLTCSLFSDPASAIALRQAQVASQMQNPPMGMRLRLLIDASASELHALHWETLRNPATDVPLCTDENILFSRYLSSLDWHPVRLRPQGELSALVVIANPINLADYRLAPIDVAGELQRACAGLGTITLTSLPSSKSRATMQAMIEILRDCTTDIVYLICHGALIKGEPWLWLEDEAGRVAQVAGNDLVTRLMELIERPRLIVLVSCQSADMDSGDALVALGPRLARAGIPAVLAMQGRISMETITHFIPSFFRALQHDGQIDRAVAVARGIVRDRPDAWMPVLFSRLKSGRIWYVPGFSGGVQEFEHWESLITFIQEQRCTPIIGPGLAEPWLGQASELAHRWAARHGYPFASHDQEDLPRIAQYIQRREGPQYLRLAFYKALREELLRRHRSDIPDDLLQAETWSPDRILRALEIAAAQSWKSNSTEGHRHLAELRLPIYITTSPGHLLTQALICAGATPQMRLCPWWSHRIPESKWRYDDEPTVERPLVYHLFGHIGTPESLVLSEDHFFDFLIGVTRNRDLIPDTVVNALTSTALLFLGFRTDDWDFRVLFRTLMAQEGSAQLRDYKHVTAQIEPEEDHLINLQRARKHIEQVFNKDNIGVYWGHSDAFLSALAAQMHKAGGHQ